MIGVARYPADVDSLTHGWRWYRVQDGKLLSPLAPMRVELARDGVLENAYFVPGIDEIASMLDYINHCGWYEPAISFGEVTGPFKRDPDMPRIGSMQCASYAATRIYVKSTALEAISANYDVPVSAFATRAVPYAFATLPA